MAGWRRKVFDAPGLTQAPPGQYLEKVARRWKRKIYVTSSGYDDIGKVLDSMGVDVRALRWYLRLRSPVRQLRQPGTTSTQRSCAASSTRAAVSTPPT